MRHGEKKAIQNRDIGIERGRCVRDWFVAKEISSSVPSWLTSVGRERASTSI